MQITCDTTKIDQLVSAAFLKKSHSRKYAWCYK